MSRGVLTPSVVKVCFGRLITWIYNGLFWEKCLKRVRCLLLDMNPKARLKLSSTDPVQLNGICEQIRVITEKAGVDIRGPIPLPTKRIKLSTRKAPSGEGRETFESWELRVHKRIIDLPADERALRLIMRIQVPKDVNLEMEITE